MDKRLLQNNRACLKKVYWKDVREDVSKVNPKFAALVDPLDPGKDFPLYLAKYPYGSVIVDEGKFYLPSEDGALVPLGGSKISQDIKDDLLYAGENVPAGLILNRSLALSVTHGNRVLPWFLYRPGVVFAMWRYLDTGDIFHPSQVFTITAGARCIFMLPNIGDVGLHRNLRRDFNVHAPPPKQLLDQWDVFVDIIRHPALKCDWSTQLLFFSDKWLDCLKHDKAWYPMHFHFLNLAWKNTAYWRNQMFYDFALSCVQANRNLKPNPYLADTVKHLLAIAVGAAPGFSVGLDNELAPVDLLQKAYVESYGLKKYIPTFMCPAHFSFRKKNAVTYYSLQYPTTLEFSPKSRKLSSTLRELSELQHITKTFMDEILKGKLAVQDTVICELAEETQFDFYHSKFDTHGEIKLTKEMPDNDQGLLKCSEKYKNRDFADSAAFVRGCVQISRKEKEG